MTRAASAENNTMNDRTSVLSALLLSCQECRRPWLDERERWRLYVDADEPGSTVPYCPDCAAREFDGD
jgi:hypothetical protein